MGYAIPIVQGGSGLPVYSGQRRQVGGSFFSTIRRIAVPLLKQLWPLVKKIGTRFGKSAVNVGTGLAGDLISGRARDIPQNFRKRGREEMNSIAQDYIGQDVFPPSTEQQEGSGRRKRGRVTKKKAKGINMRGKSVNKKRKQQALNTDIFSRNNVH